MCSPNTTIVNSKLDAAIKEILKKEDIKEYVFEITEGSSKGDGYSTTITRVKITGKTNDNLTKTLDLILKRALDSDAFRDKFPLTQVFKTEIHMYSKVFPAFKSFEIENNLNPSLIHPPFYYGTDEDRNETIIMENIKSQGFKMHEGDVVDNHHMDLVLNQCARLHALSFALRERQPTKFADLVFSYNLLRDLIQKFLRQSVLDLFAKTLSILDPDTDSEIVEKFTSFVENLDSYVELWKTHLDDKTSVILHGDLWQNNIMYKYEDSTQPTKPTQVRMFDFQCSKLGPPAMDLIYLFYGSCSSELYENWDQHLNAYYTNLSNYLKLYKCDASKLYPFSVLEEQWKTCAKFAIIPVQFLARIKSSGESDLVDFEASAESNAPDSCLSFKDSCNEEVYRNIMKPFLSHLIKNKFL